MFRNIILNKNISLLGVLGFKYVRAWKFDIYYVIRHVGNEKKKRKKCI